MAYTALILGDSAGTREGVADCLDNTGLVHRKLYCKDARRAIRWLSEYDIDIVCCDWCWDAHEEISDLMGVLRRRPEWHDLPVLLFTSGDDRQLWLTGMELGVSECLSLALPMEEHRVKIRWHLNNRERIQSLHQAQSQLARIALSDGLTGLFNRAYFDATISQELARCARRGLPLTLLMVDLDHFKKINDTYGHLAGDKALEAVGQVLSAMSRTSDTVCRFGGEEFAIILPETTNANAVIVAERIRKKIAQLDLGFTLTASIGVGSAKVTKSLLPEHIIAEADGALYEAKRKGRNRVETVVMNTGVVSDLRLFKKFKVAMATA
ncbi:MAG: diguanylate cyclase [Pedobacter sp.]